MVEAPRKGHIGLHRAGAETLSRFEKSSFFDGFVFERERWAFSARAIRPSPSCYFDRMPGGLITIPQQAVQSQFLNRLQTSGMQRFFLHSQ